MPKEYRTIREVAGPLMLVQGVENVTFDELAEIELANGESVVVVFRNRWFKCSCSTF